jgi:hypothetical protein
MAPVPLPACQGLAGAVAGHQPSKQDPGTTGSTGVDPTGGLVPNLPVPLPSAPTLGDLLGAGLPGGGT